jgi:HTH-type transcriptional regulator/antitoxin HigA
MASAKTTYPFEPDYAVAPGQTLAETLESLGMSQAELALRTGLTEVSINRIIKGVQPITAETANKLELVTGVPAGMWNNLEAQYRGQLARIADHERFEKDRDWLKTIPIKELIKRKAVPNTKDEAVLVRQTLAFYGVSSVATYREVIQRHGVAARRSQKFTSDPAALAAWLRFGELEAAKIACQPYSKDAFQKAIAAIRDLTTEDPKVFVRRMIALCAEAGVAVALVPEMPKAPWYGASKWLTPDKAMILLNLRGKREDQFWFSFFHEAGHILHDSKKELFTNDGSSDDPCEKRANSYAENLLIPKAYCDRIEALRTAERVVALAKELGIAPGIVVGQFQRRTKKWNWFHDLIRKFDWTK